MTDLEKAVKTQLENIEKKTGKSLNALTEMIKQSGVEKHGAIREMLIKDLGLGFGDANTLVHYARQSDGPRAAQAQDFSVESVIDNIYSGVKADLRPIHDQLMKEIQGFGEFEVAPKKGYVSLRRKKQFVMVGPATNTRVEVGINHKSLMPAERLIAQPAGSMCNFIVRLTRVEGVNAEFIEWIHQAYENAG